MQFSGSVPPSSSSPGLLYYSAHTHGLMPTPSNRLYHFTRTPSPRQTQPDTSTPPSHTGEFGSGEMGEVNQKGNRMLEVMEGELLALGIIVDCI